MFSQLKRRTKNKRDTTAKKDELNKRKRRDKKNAMNIWTRLTITFEGRLLQFLYCFHEDSNTVPSKRVQLKLWNVIFERKHQIKSQVISQNSKVAIWTLHWRLNLILSEWLGSGWCPSAAWWCFSLKRLCERSVQDLAEKLFKTELSTSIAPKGRIVKMWGGETITLEKAKVEFGRKSKIIKSGCLWEKKRITKSAC